MTTQHQAHQTHHVHHELSNTDPGSFDLDWVMRMTLRSYIYTEYGHVIDNRTVRAFQIGCKRASRSFTEGGPIWLLDFKTIDDDAGTMALYNTGLVLYVGGSDTDTFGPEYQWGGVL